MKNGKQATLLLALMAIMTLPAIVSAQEQERHIEKLSWRTEPIKILTLKTKNKTVELDKKFSEEDDWLRGFTVSVQNVFDKAIAHIELSLFFPPPKGSAPDKPTLVVPMIYGKDPALISPSEVPELVLPGESVDIKLLEENLPGIKEDMENLGYGRMIKQAQIMVRSVTFVDGSEWRGDQILYPDPNNPKKKINPKYQILREMPGFSGLLRNESSPLSKGSGLRFLNAGLRRDHAHAPVTAPIFYLENFGCLNYLGLFHATRFLLKATQRPADPWVRVVHIPETTLLKTGPQTNCGKSTQKD
jgi:hypothetical protein